MRVRRLVRIDFTPAGTRCVKCRREIDTAHVIARANDAEEFYGPECAKSLFDKEEFKLMIASTPNLTLHRRGETPHGNPSSQGPVGTHGVANDDAKRAYEYLWLRMDKIAQLCPDRRGFLLWKPLVEKFEYLKEKGELSDLDVRMVLSTEQKAPPELSRMNLLDVYSAAMQLKKKLRTENNEFIRGLLNYLKSNLRLTKAQMESVRIELPESAFGWHATKD